MREASLLTTAGRAEPGAPRWSDVGMDVVISVFVRQHLTNYSEIGSQCLVRQVYSAHGPLKVLSYTWFWTKKIQGTI